MIINEWFASINQLRAETLKKGIISMIDDPTLVNKIYNHPLIFGLWKSTNNKRTDISSKDPALEQIAATIAHGTKIYSQGEMLRPPSYIPPKQLATAAIDLIRSSKANTTLAAQELRDGIEKLPEGPFKYAILSMLNDANDNVEEFRLKLECWFNDGMDRISGWYRRHMQLIAFIVGAVVTVACNADTFQIINTLYRDAAIRGAVVSTASTYVASGGVNLVEITFPIGWSMQLPNNFIGWLTKLIGWFLTASALSLGAPFWFDILNKIVNLRLTGKKPEDLKNCERSNNEK